MNYIRVPVTQSFSWPEGIRAAVSLTFDDGRRSQWQYGVPLLNDFGVKATFYVLPKALEENLERWQAVCARGHEIGNHSLTHPCSGNFPFAQKNPLEEYSLEMMAKELDEASQRLAKSLGTFPESFAYPCGQKFVGRGAEARSYVPLVADRFLAGRGWRDEHHNAPGFCDMAQLFAVPIDGLDADDAKAQIDAAAREGGWLIFAGHDIGSKKTTRQVTLEKTLVAVCEYVRENSPGIWLDTVKTIANYVRDFRREMSSQQQ
ncbi:MAG TPA: polysaccharide deacetylase family protein [Candidatus Hydrogenedentes bacterium]|nr:polysaccharide deacetylase family protein [Candidatus Hydrogenedentota bacterium]HOL75705.1 polysaccharide deacetylase family protein [Candidatus Hydrogenedentota bacterium]HPO84302.1 polysaccharide deacetylase family protein [Candidatus Hydrogenedentota bacterium]